MCLNPAYRGYLPDVAAALSPVLGEVAGLPGAPVRATQVGAAYYSAARARPAQADDDQRPPAGAAGAARRAQLAWRRSAGTAARSSLTSCKLLSAHAFVGAGAGPGTPAQQAVQAALLQGAGVPFAAQPKVADHTRAAVVGAGKMGRPSNTGARAGACRRAGLRRGPAAGGAAARAPGTPGSPPTWARCEPVSSRWRSCRDRRRDPTGRHREPRRRAGLAGPPLASLRLAWLYLVSRRGPAARWACWPPSARCCGPRCTGSGRWPAARPRGRWSRW